MEPNEHQKAFNAQELVDFCKSALRMNHQDTDRVIKVAGFTPGATFYADTVAKRLEDALMGEDLAPSHDVIRVQLPQINHQKDALD